ncbi:hypothetical protein FoTM2_013494 [Fusarium oxysporum f. sp. vasinfectum]|nr:hypothetical protein FoTM2_013494 [Fusarium oxysporum f. sp. vasinfectum]
MDVSDIPSSQETVEDPTLPGSSSEGATMILTPDNTEAPLAFHGVAEWLHSQPEDPDMQAVKQHTRKCMWISSKQQNDPEAGRWLQGASESLSSSSPIASPRDPKSSSRSNKKYESRDRFEIWKGHYFVSLMNPPEVRQEDG